MNIIEIFEQLTEAISDPVFLAAYTFFTALFSLPFFGIETLLNIIF